MLGSKDPIAMLALNVQVAYLSVRRGEHVRASLPKSRNSPPRATGSSRKGVNGTGWTTKSITNRIQRELLRRGACAKARLKQKKALEEEWGEEQEVTLQFCKCASSARRLGERPAAHLS